MRAAEWGRNFTTELTVKGLHFQWNYQNGLAHFRDLVGKNIPVMRDFKPRGFYYIIYLSVTNVPINFRMTLIKGFLR